MSETVVAPRVLIMGVGNILLRDEGFGVAAVNHLEKNYYWPENVRLQEGATQGLLLMSELEECDLLVVLDVVLGGKEPGTVYLLENEDLSRSLSFQGSMHQTDLLQTLQVCELAGCRPQCLAFGLQPFDWRTMQVGHAAGLCGKGGGRTGPARHRGPPERNGLSGISGIRPLHPGCRCPQLPSSRRLWSAAAMRLLPAREGLHCSPSFHPIPRACYRRVRDHDTIVVSHGRRSPRDGENPCHPASPAFVASASSGSGSA